MGGFQYRRNPPSFSTCMINRMKCLLKAFLVLGACLCSLPELSAQMLIVDRGPSSGPTKLLGLQKANAFLADDFQVGAAKEDWIIDHIRMWAVPAPNRAPLPAPGELFQKISLYGGIAPIPNQPAADECDCHNLPALKSAVLRPGNRSSSDHDVQIVPIRRQDGREVWQIDFENLMWSVPGATRIQFGILAESRLGLGHNSNSTWYNLASPAAEGEHLRVFSDAGNFQGPYSGEQGARMNIQVWGHLFAKISMSPAGQELPSHFRAQADSSKQNKMDTATLGRREAKPDRVSVEHSGHRETT